jgi:ribonuclease R
MAEKKQATRGARARADRRKAAHSNDSEPVRREDVLAFIAAYPERANKRDIAKHFGLRGEDRIRLKQILRALEDEGLLEKKSRRFFRPDGLPHVTVLDIVSREDDGSLIARPAEERFGGEDGPLVRIRRPAPGREAAAGVGDRVLARIFTAETDADVAYAARIMRLIEKNRDAVLGVLRKAGDGRLWIEPVERRQPEYAVADGPPVEAQPGDLVEAIPLRSGRLGLPRARILSVIGSMSSEKAVSMIAIHAHDIPHIFPAEVLAEAEKATATPLEEREDWRQMPLVTIDPADARDHDDAVWAEPDADPANPGGHIVYVAIADVAAYVRPGSALDREALRRGNSVYFPDRVVPMLPERISNDLCSLREGEERPALAVRMVFSAGGAKRHHTFHRVMMRSAARLSYPQAQAAMDGHPDDTTRPLLQPALEPLWEAWRVLRRGRRRRQPLELDLPERKLLLNADGTVAQVTVPERLDAHRLIEEFMIQANVAAAETLEARRQPLLYRIHDSPALAKQEALREFLQTIGLSLARGPQLKPAQFNEILARVRGSDVEPLVNEVVLRAQSQAEYAPGNIGHFGLNLRRYAHFTSPIRRYADLVVHRALIRALRFGPDGLTPAEEERLEEIGALISTAERRAMAAERDTVDRLVAAHLAGRRGEIFEARISGVTKAGLFVKLPEYGADGFIPVSTLGRDYYAHDEAGHVLAATRTGAGYRLGDAVEVRLVEVVPLAGSMRFEMLSPPRDLPVRTRSDHKARRAATRRKKAAGGRRRSR